MRKSNLKQAMLNVAKKRHSNPAALDILTEVAREVHKVELQDQIEMLTNRINCQAEDFVRDLNREINDLDLALESPVYLEPIKSKRPFGVDLNKSGN